MLISRLLACCCILVSANLVAQIEHSTPTSFTWTQVDTQIVGTFPQIEQSTNDGVLTINGTDKSVRLIRGKQLVKKIGQLGTGPGQFYTPLVAANDNYIVDVEWPSQRVQWFSKDGAYLSTCRLSSDITTRTVALTNKNLLVVNDSHAAHPIVFMDRDCKVVGAIGSRENVSSLYGASNRSKDQAFADASNRVELVASGDYIYAAYLLAPVVKKYNVSGKLLFTLNLDHSIDNSFWSYTVAAGGISTGVDSVQVPLVMRSISIDPQTGKIWVLAATDLKRHTALYQVSEDGKKVATYPVPSPDRIGEIRDMAIYAGSLYCSLVFARGVYSSPLPQS